MRRRMDMPVFFLCTYYCLLRLCTLYGSTYYWTVKPPRSDYHTESRPIDVSSGHKNEKDNPASDMRVQREEGSDNNNNNNNKIIISCWEFLGRSKWHVWRPFFHKCRMQAVGNWSILALSFVGPKSNNEAKREKKWMTQASNQLQDRENLL